MTDASREPLGGLPLRAGDVLAGTYRLERVVGEGGTGVVVAALHLGLQRRVAIKFLRAALADDEVRLRFAREARAIARLRSPYVVRVIGAGTLPDGAPYMVQEFLDGRDLARVLREDGPLPIGDAVDCMVQVCDALAEAHAIGIVHRDLKPANLFLTRLPDGAPHVHVVDFGISKILAPAALGQASTDAAFDEVTRDRTALGSPRYMAPEQIRSSRDVDARADLWSLGAVLFHLVSNQHAFPAPSSVMATVRVLTGEPEGLCAVLPGAPRALELVLLRCFAKDPAERWQTAHELAAALRHFGTRASRL